MQIAIHLGAHCTDGGRLLKTLLRNAGLLANEGTSIPGPGRYRAQLARFLRSDGPEPTPDAGQALIDSLTDRPETRRIVLSHAGLLGPVETLVGSGRLYADAGLRMARLARLLAGQQIELFLALRDPASLIPSAWHMPGLGRQGFSDFLGGSDPEALRWSETIAVLKQAMPGVPITLWCREDAPLIWPQVLAAISDHAPGCMLDGRFDLLEEILRPAGLRRLQGWLADNPPLSLRHEGRIMAAFAEKYAREDALEEELDAPGWSQDLIERMSAQYERDLARIEAMPGLCLIQL